MATWFSGTSTDSKYEVGKSYIGSQGDRMTAQADGSFYNERTGRSSVGSSQDSSVQWSSDSASDRMPGFWTDQGRYVPGPTFGSAGVGYDTTPGGSNTSGAGGGGAGSADTAGPGNGGAGSRRAGSSLKLGDRSRLTPTWESENTSLTIGGVYIEAPRGFSNVEEWEKLFGEPGEWLGAPFVVGGTIGHNLRRGWDHFAPIYNDHMASQPPVTGGDGWEKLVQQDRIWSQQLHRTFGTGVVVPMGGF